jgi:hypothetical protein
MYSEPSVTFFVLLNVPSAFMGPCGPHSWLSWTMQSCRPVRWVNTNSTQSVLCNLHVSEACKFPCRHRAALEDLQSQLKEKEKEDAMTAAAMKKMTEDVQALKQGLKEKEAKLAEASRKVEEVRLELTLPDVWLSRLRLDLWTESGTCDHAT